jgi:hypothetical protein
MTEQTALSIATRYDTAKRSRFFTETEERLSSETPVDPVATSRPSRAPLNIRYMFHDASVDAVEYPLKFEELF